jgi:Taurine catabolism dioxygenase TauD, TfdA family
MAAMAIPMRPIDTPDAWRGEDLARSRDWIRPFSAPELDELHGALGVVTRRGLAWRDITRADFPLPRLAPGLAAVGRALEHGRGIALLRGLPVDRYTEEELRRLYWGIGVHLGAPRYQNAQGELIGEVRDEVRVYGAVQELKPAAASEAPTSRYKARSSGPLRFHTDRADVVALLCVRQADSGGLSKVASSVAVHNEMLARRPDLHALLFGDYHRTRQGEEAGGEGSVYALPVWGVRDGRFTSQYSRTFVEAAQRRPDVPRLTAAQDEALDLLADLCEELCHTMALEPGDIQLLNNHVTYHARTAYVDAPDARRDRLLFRLWLSTPESRALPPGFEVLWGSVEPGALRGGIEQPASRSRS